VINLDFSKKTILILVFLVAALLCGPVNAHEETAEDISAEIAEHSDELFSSAESILLDTKAIVKDDSVDQEIRDLAKTIHLVSHKLEDIGADLQEDSAKLQELTVDPAANKVAIENIIAEMKTYTANYTSMLQEQHENIHELVFTVPESREDNADAVHDAAHNAEDIADHLNEHLTELSAALDAPATASAGTTKTTVCMNNGDVTVKLTEIKGYSDELFTSAESILLDTKAIVKDETVDQEIRDLAKTIHLVSHKLEDIGADLQEDSAELEKLSADPTANEAAIEVLIAKMETNTANYTSMLQGQHENIHELVFTVPESREDNADAVHDAAHGAEDIADHLSEQLTGFTTALNSPAGEETLAPATSKTSAPGFSALLALCAVLGTVALLVRRK